MRAATPLRALLPAAGPEQLLHQGGACAASVRSSTYCREDAEFRGFKPFPQALPGDWLGALSPK